VTVITRQLVQQTATESRDNERRRIVQPFHRTNEDLLRRMLNGIQPDSYTRPHRHPPLLNEEAWLVLQGALALVFFEEDGAVSERLVLRAGSDAFGVDFLGDRFHTLVVLEPDTVIYEVKLGPYAPLAGAEVATWAPAERTSEAVDYLEQLRRAATST
jgi:cupin fold WbuC family metalloprotein